ncbi:MAG TPA: glycosyltransferase family 1 protein [Catalimonadaceae bacterium]|nr:glycosyltransferase family 1 protein [Catalimonadaceae bacterium]
MIFAYCATIQPKFGGLRSFNIGLAHALKAQLEIEGHQLFLITKDEFKSDYSGFGNTLITYSGNHLIFENTRLPFLLKRLEVDFAILPHNRIPTWKSGSYKLVCIFHDLLFWRFPERFSMPKRLLRGFFLRNAARNSDYSFSVSGFTANELAEYLPGHHSDVCYQAIAPISTQNSDPVIDVAKEFLLSKPYFLFIGAQSFQKNLPAVIEAFGLLRKQGNEAQLVLGGGKGSAESEIRQAIAQSEFTKDILVTGYLNENQKVALMKNSIAFVFPSIYEGFGIPLLEAFQLGVPVICSNSSCLPEISNGAALEVDPNAGSLARGMAEFLQKPDFRATYKAKGLTRIKEFTWEKTATVILSRLLANS